MFTGPPRSVRHHRLGLCARRASSSTTASCAGTYELVLRLKRSELDLDIPRASLVASACGARAAASDRDRMDAGLRNITDGLIRDSVAVGTTVNPSPPAQIRTCRLPAYGSYLEWVARKRASG